MKIRNFGAGGRALECERILDSRLACITDGELILLPIPTTRDNKYITKTAFTIEDICAMIDTKTKIAGYGIPRRLLSAASENGAMVFDAGLDEEFLLQNAELTARGAIGHILTHLDRDLGDTTVGVVGYGRIGKSLVKWLLRYGAHTVLYTGRREVMIDMGEMGVSARLVGENADFSDIDILINTAPARQVDESRLNVKTEVIDLASGKVFENSPNLTKLSSIPDAFYPLTAGRLYAEAILRGLWGEKL